MAQALTQVAIALGSNLGDSFFNIELALRLLEHPQEYILQQDQEKYNLTNPICHVVNTSFLYETAPMYVKDQPSFINCACIVETNIPAKCLLVFLKQHENALGRVPSIRNGPRAVDLDILLYGDQIIDTRPPEQRSDLENLEGHLVVPHPRMAEREFVLRPLHDMIPDYVHPTLQQSIQDLLLALPEEDPTMRKVIPFPAYPAPSDDDWPYPFIPPVPKSLTQWIYRITDKKQLTKVTRKTHIMATINATPDSYSRHKSTDTAVEYARYSIEAGASLIDIGGYSAQPGSAFVTTEEETRRVVPFVIAVSNARLRDTPISIDTFRPEVAEAAIKVGVNCINDIYAFTGRESWPCVEEAVQQRAEEEMRKMKKVARDYATPCIMVHSRADAGEDEDYSMYLDGAEGSAIRGIQVELGAKIDRAVLGKGGIRRWMVIVDPGIGFSKNTKDNIEVLRDCAKVVGDSILDQGTPSQRRNPLRGYSQLIATSRKAFLQEILREGDCGRETTPKERVFATATTIACAVQQGALVVRVHDVQDMFDVAKVADVLW